MKDYPPFWLVLMIVFILLSILASIGELIYRIAGADIIQAVSKHEVLLYLLMAIVIGLLMIVCEKSVELAEWVYYKWKSKK